MVSWTEIVAIMALLTLIIIGASFLSWCRQRVSQLSSRTLCRNGRHGLLAGVCAGVADYLSLKHSVVRALACILCLVTGLLPGLLIYCLLAIILPAGN